MSNNKAKAQELRRQVVNHATYALPRLGVKLAVDTVEAVHAQLVYITNVKSGHLRGNWQIRLTPNATELGPEHNDKIGRATIDRERGKLREWEQDERNLGKSLFCVNVVPYGPFVDARYRLIDRVIALFSGLKPGDVSLLRDADQSVSAARLPYFRTIARRALKAIKLNVLRTLLRRRGLLRESSKQDKIGKIAERSNVLLAKHTGGGAKARFRRAVREKPQE